MALRFACFIGSTREGRMADRLIRLVQTQFDSTMAPKGHQLQFIDPTIYELPLLNKPLHFHSDWSEAPKILHELNNTVSTSDAFFILTPEYNMSLPPGLTNLMSHLPPPSYEYKPSGIISYTMGTRGGLGVCIAARPFLSELGCIPVKHMSTISMVHKEVDENGTTKNKMIEESLTQLFEQVEWWGDATKQKRTNDGVPKAPGRF